MRCGYHGCANDVRVLSRCAGLVFLVCVEAMSLACASRTAPPAAPGPEVASPVEPPVDPAPVPDPPSPSPPVAPLPEAPSASCALIAEPGKPIATIGLGERVNPANAPHPSNDSERLLFRQVYETLVRVDCEGRVVPALAASWQLDATGRTWTVTLRENARFSDGTPVTAADVRVSWTRDGAGVELRPEVNRLVQAIVAIDDRTLAITLRRQRTDAPLVLAHTDLAIARSVPDSLWPLGTKSNRITSERDRPVVTSTTGTLSSIRFLVATGDPRDLLDEGVDLLLTRNPAALDYAATLLPFQSVPLPWQRTHVLLTPGRPRTAPSLSEEARRALADDAVRGEARGAMGPFWWEAVADCEVAASQAREVSPRLTPRIVYDDRDGAARDLAERFVAIGDTILPDRPRRTYQRATGLTGEALALARRRGTDAGYIMSLDSRPLDPCRELQVVMDGAPWLDRQAIVPLVDTRLHAIVRRGHSGVIADSDGGLVLASRITD
jgi:hypothetical protein